MTAPDNESGNGKWIALLATAAILWSTGGILIKIIDWHPLAISGGRSMIAAAILYFSIKNPIFTFSRNQILAAVAYSGCTGLFVLATKLTTAANAIVLQYSGPVFVALLSGWMLDERPRRIDWITVCLAFVGMAVFFVDDLDFSALWGNAAAVASGVSFAFLAIFLRKQKHGSPIESLALGNILNGIIALPFMVSNGLPDSASLLALAALGIFQLGIPYVLYGRAIRHVTALEATLIPVIEPILNPVWVMLLLGETPKRFALAGAFIVILSVVGRGVIPILLRPRKINVSL